MVLRNFVRDIDNCMFQDAVKVADLEDVPAGHSVRVRLTANSVRNKELDCYLTDDGAVPWQM